MSHIQFTPYILYLSQGEDHDGGSPVCDGTYRELHVINLAQPAAAAEYTDSSNKYSGYETKHSDGEASALLELRGVPIILSLPSLPGPLSLWAVVSDRILSMGQ